MTKNNMDILLGNILGSAAISPDNKTFKFRKFNLQLLIYKCRKYVSYLPPC